MSKRSPRYESVFFSPHLDDAVLSCGGLLARMQARHEKTLVVTLFTKAEIIANPSTDLLHFLNQSTSKTSKGLFQKRRQEDVRASQFLGFDVLHLSCTDALWRTQDGTQLYPTFQTLFSGSISHKDTSLIDKITQTSTTVFSHLKNNATVYAPLGVGNHVDHIITFQIVQSLAKQLRKKCLFWEDIPYRNQLGAREKRFSTLGTLPQPSIFTCSTPEANRKEKACALYTSQIKTLKTSGLGPIDYAQERYFEL